MKKKVALIFGSHGGIGHATMTAFITAGYRIIPVARDIIDFNDTNFDRDIDSLLTNSRPDVIVNATGVFINGYDAMHFETMNVNFGSNWSIVKHYAKEKNQGRPTRIIMIGSSSHNGGRKLYPLYSASKAALYNLWQSAQQQFENTSIQIDLVNPVRTLTKMSSTGKNVDSNLDYLSPEQVAYKILMLAEENQVGKCIDITFEEAK